MIKTKPPVTTPMTKAAVERSLAIYGEPKRQITIRLDKVVLDWFRAQGPGYQTRINEVLRAAMEGRNER